MAVAWVGAASSARNNRFPRCRDADGAVVVLHDAVLFFVKGDVFFHGGFAVSGGQAPVGLEG